MLTLSPKSILTVNGSFSQGSTATLTVQIGGTAALPTFGSIASGAAGTVSLNGTLKVTSTVVVPINTSFELLNNQGAGTISGIFTGLAEGG
jgi:hypothetical protein